MSDEALKRLTRDDTEHGVKYYRADQVDALLQNLRKRPGFAGVTLWLGEATVTQLVTEHQISLERKPGQALTWAAHKCLAVYAAARGSEVGA